MKPVVERFLAAVALVPGAVVVGAAVLYVRRDLDEGEAFFKQLRVGKDGRVFTMYKLRTMRNASDEGSHHARSLSAAVSADELRMTPRGRQLRAWSIDELPQLVNVLRGEMSLVGPRPELVEIVDELGLWGHPRHLVRPGMTGQWQISDKRLLPLRLHMEEDVVYVRRAGVRTDMRILARTAAAVCRKMTR